MKRINLKISIELRRELIKQLQEIRPSLKDNLIKSEERLKNNIKKEKDYKIEITDLMEELNK